LSGAVLSDTGVITSISGADRVGERFPAIMPSDRIEIRFARSKATAARS
jgi:hypothetical protein